MDNNDLGDILFDKLKDFYHDKDFVCGVSSMVETDKERQAIIDYMDKGENVTTSNIILLALSLDRNRINNNIN